MKLTEKQFEKYLMLYGTDIDKWPEKLLAEALGTPSVEALVIRQQYVDETLLSNDDIPPASPNLNERILRRARLSGRKKNFNLMDWLVALFADFSLPQPAYVLAAVLLLGLGIGVSDPGRYSDAGGLEEATLADDGAVL